MSQHNPFESPQSYLTRRDQEGPEETVLQQVTPVAVILLSLASFDLACRVLMVASSAIQTYYEEAPDGFSLWNVFNMVGLGVNILVLFGAASMLQRRRYPLAITAAILESIPGLASCFILGMPFGIWALVLLSMQKVRATFAIEPRIVG